MRSVVRAHSGPPFPISGGLAQLGERLICIQEVSGSIPLFSTTGFNRFVYLENWIEESKATERAASPEGDAAQSKQAAKWKTFYRVSTIL